MMSKQEETYRKVKEYIKKNPGTGVWTAIQKTGSTPSTYYNEVRKRAGNPYTKKKKKAAPRVIDVPVAPSKSMVIVCDTSDLRNVLRNLGD